MNIANSQKGTASVWADETGRSYKGATMAKNRFTTSLHYLLLSGLLCLSLPGVAQNKQVPSSANQDVVSKRLDNELERIAKLAKGKVGICALHLESGKQVSLNLQERFPMASTVKVAIAVELLTQIEQGKLSLMTMVDLQPADLHPGSGTLEVLFAKPGVQLSVQNLLELMMVISDNSATDILFRLVGGPSVVMNRVKELGIQGMSVDRTIIQLIADLEGITLPASSEWTPGFYDKLWKNTTPASRMAAEQKLRLDPRDTATPEAMVNLLAQIYRGKALKPESRDLLIAVMERCRGGAARLKGYLPPETVVAHKTGTLNASATDDVGIITLPDGAGHIAIAVFVANSEQPLAEREQTIAQVTRTIYDYFLFQTPALTSSTR